jgi:two-component system, OmpR family, sensor kinase
MSRLPLRIRLTLAFAGATAVLLGAVGVFVFFEVKSGLDASLDASLAARAAQYARLAARPDGGALRRALSIEGEPAQLLTADGRVLAASPRGRVASLVGPGRLRRARTGVVRFERAERVRLVARPAGGGRVVVVATSMVQRERALEELGRVLLVGGPLILLLSSGAG